MSRLFWTADALDDLDRIDAFNLDRSADWARRVQFRIGQRCATLVELPLQGRAVERSLRALSIPDIQYVVTYEVTAVGVLVHRILSTRESKDRK